MLNRDYYETERYPGPKYYTPSRDEVERYFDKAEKWIDQIIIHIG